MALQVPRPFRKPETGVYYYRRTVPDDLILALGKKEIRRTLRTKDPKVAARRFADVAREVEMEWAELRRSPPAPAFSHLDPQYLIEDAMLADGILDERDAPEDWEPAPKALRAAIRARTGASVALEVAEQVAKRTLSTEAPRLSLSDMLEGWWTEAKAIGRKPSTFESYRNTIANLRGFLGHDDATKVAPEDVVRFKDHRLAQGLSAKTVKDSDLAALKTAFGWAVTNRKLPSNPATGITIKLGKPKRLRSKGLTEEETKALLSAALAIPSNSTSRTDQARRWVPLLAIYSGARVGELAQLRREDVTKEGASGDSDGHWLIHITPEAGTVKTNEARKVALHPHLIELGFPEWVRRQPEGHLFLKPSPTGDVLGPLQGVKNRLAEFARTVITDPNVAPLHGLRHRFKTVGMDIGVPQRVLDAIQGHAARTASDGYGEVSVKAMAMWIERVPRVVV